MDMVRVLGPQTIHIAMCLEFVVEEILRVRARNPIKKYVHTHTHTHTCAWLDQGVALGVSSSFATSFAILRRRHNQGGSFQYGGIECLHGELRD